MEAVKCEAFLAAAELGSLTAAAELLGYTQSGVTRMIGTLEEELGFPLFLRSKKGVQLTENGKLMLPLLREIVRAHRNAEQFGDLNAMSAGMCRTGPGIGIGAVGSQNCVQLPDHANPLLPVTRGKQLCSHAGQRHAPDIV